MALCAGGCGQEAVPGGDYHCLKGEPGYAACKQRAYRQRKGSDNTGNAGNVTQIREAVEGVMTATLQQQLGELSYGNEVQIEILEELRRLRIALENQPRETAPRHTYAPSPNTPAPEVLDDIELEITEATSGVNANANFIYGMLMIAGKTEEAQAMREDMTKQSGPKPLARADVVFDAPDFDDDDFDI